ncbi:down syndrome cell adhesion molecule-like protein Dscam2 [Nephila pilipes]|uniref:Down syndrome cell adhesion molecule-like protein Dscam2 n=1 Tax=Nephila pilipes TaxID=299642 RepID=A0A8X6R0W0_NEPPI|nr:down syndrome cell adhesion molecule-like protein Dscam2 [Nephila pilipes]
MLYEIIFCCIIVPTCFSFRNDSPRIKEFTFPSRVVVGSRTFTMCFSENADLPVTFKWYKDSKPILNLTGVTIKTDDEFSVIIINPVSESSKGHYTCSIKNSFGEVSYTAILTVVGKENFYVRIQVIRLDFSSSLNGQLTDCQLPIETPSNGDIVTPGKSHD